MDKFIVKAFENKNFIASLSKLKSNVWNKLSNNGKIEALNDIVSYLSCLCEEFGKCKFEFVFEANNRSGEYFDGNNVINLETGERNQYVILATIFHELRHFYQDKAEKMYIEKGIIHEMFKDTDFISIINNNASSKLMRVENYLDYKNNNFFEYCIQPYEFDAECFSKNVMNYYSDNFLDDEDYKLAMRANCDYDDLLKIINKNDRNLVDYTKKYKLNYMDYVSEGKDYFVKDEIIFDRYQQKLTDISLLDKENIIILCTPCFWNNYSNDIRFKLLKRYFEIENFEVDIKYYDSLVCIKDKIVKFSDIGKVMEVVFNILADNEIDKMLHKKNNRYLTKIEREIRLNLKDEKNIIKKDENPLFYEVQPYMLYKNNYILRNFYDLYRLFDVVYGNRDNYFINYCDYIKKYDVESKMKKVSLLTGEKFDDFYDNMITKMRNRKTR